MINCIIVGLGGFFRRCGSSICCAVDLWKIKMFLKEID